MDMTISFLSGALNLFKQKLHSMQFLKKISVFSSLTQGNVCFQQSRLNPEKTIHGISPCVNFKVVFRIKNSLSSKFTFKDKISKEMHFLLSYKFQCSSRNTTYYGKNKCLFKIRVSEHIWVSPHAGKYIKFTKNSAVCDHMLVCDNIVSFDDFSVLAYGTSDFRIKLYGSLLIHRKYIKFTKNSAVCDHMLVCDNIVSFDDFSVLAYGTSDFRIKLYGSLLIHRHWP